MALQLHPMTSVMQLSITAAGVFVAAASVIVAVAAIIFAIKSMSDERNARLVEIGVRVLRVDSRKETQISAAREWALNLIDANAGVKFSPQARADLLKHRRPRWLILRHIYATLQSHLTPRPGSQIVLPQLN
jgi:hypothetical protein